MNLQMLQDKATLKCFLVASNSNWLRLGPMKVETKSMNPLHSVIKELIYPHECDKMSSPLVHLLDKRRKNYKKPSPTKDWTDIRVMKK